MFRKDLSRKNLIIRSFLAVLVLAVMVLFWIYQDFLFSGTASADSESHSDVFVDGYSLVLDDLKQDSSFDPDVYPDDNSDYSLSVIQIAESEDDELFLYVYQPYIGNDYDLTAYKVSLSTTVGDGNLKYVLYDLTLLNYDGVFYKYRVDDLSVSGASVHYYDISAIYRPFYTSIDSENVLDNVTRGLGIAVGQEWTVSYYNGSKYYWVDELRVEYCDIYTSWVRFQTGVGGSTGSSSQYYTDVHFVAFNVFFDIDTLLEADLSYTLNYYYYDSAYPKFNETSSEDKTYTVTYGTEVEVKNQGVFGLFGKHTYVFEEIMTPDEFHNSIEYDSNGNKTSYSYGSSEAYDYVNSSDYVLVFEQTPAESYFGSGGSFSFYYRVSNLTVLRCKYEFQGNIYDVGLVSNIADGNQSSNGAYSDVNDNDRDISNCSCNFLMWVWIILGILLFILLLPILPYIVKALIWIICAPFKFIRWCYRKNKERKQKKLDKEQSEKLDKAVDVSTNLADLSTCGIKLDSSLKFDVPDVSDDSGKSGKDKKKKNE